jgi:hypothetical protein
MCGGGDGTTTLFPVSRDSRHACALGRRAETLGIGLHHVEFQENVCTAWLHESTGAEIETALCILESVLPTLVSTRYYTRKLDQGICGSLLLRPATQEGSSETRKLGIWNLGVPWARTQAKWGAPRKLGNSESGIWVYLQTGPKRGPRKLGNSESGICREYPGICTLGILESGICGGVSRNLYIWNVGII